MGVATDRDTATMYDAVMETTKWNEVLDIVVTTN
jgi:hypothetical protein